MNTRLTLVASLIATVLLSACGSANEDSGGDSGGPGNGGGDAGSTRLITFDNDGAFLDALRAGLIARSDTQVYTGTDDLNVAQPAELPQAAPEGGGETAADSGGGGASSNEVTSTNVQEQGVDEQDWVKVSDDGTRLYVLDSAAPYYGFPLPIDGPIAIEPVFIEEDLPVGGDEPVGISLPAPQDYQTTLRILALDADAPDASSLNDLTLSLDGRYAEGFYLYENGGSRQAVLTASGNNFWAYWAEPAAFGGQTSLITRVDVTNPQNASISGSFQLDGQIISSRRIGKHLFFASRFYPRIDGPQPYEQTPEQWQETVNNATDADLLPQYSNDGSETNTPLIDPAGCFVAEQSGNDDYYYSPDIITLAVLDLDTLELTDSECYLGASETLYASPDAVFLATTQYDYFDGPVAEDGRVIDVEEDFPADIVWRDPRVATDIHQFDIDGGQLVYAGTGSVKGHLGWNTLRKPFRMSEQDGYLRVATFNDQQGGNESPILMTILQADGQGELKRVSMLPNDANPGFIGKPGEQLYASRFLGDRAYLVTFRQTDPLYVVDLADPANPRVLGELQIDGYSDYLQPIGSDYLLGIGKDAVPAPDGFGDGGRGVGALVQGIKLSLFDVSNPSAPREVQSLRVGQRGSEARALSDHRAITIQPATDSHPTRVSFGIDVAGQAFPDSAPSGDNAFTYYPWSYTGMHGFDITVGDNAGITSRGALVARTAGNNDYYYYAGYANDRSVMVNDSLFYIRGRDVYAAPWNDLANPTPAR